MTAMTEPYDFCDLQTDLSALRALTAEARSLHQQAAAVTAHRNSLLHDLHAQGVAQITLAEAAGVSHVAITYALGKSKRQKPTRYRRAS